MNKFKRITHENLTLRYLVALSLIACVIALTYFLISSQLKKAENDAVILNRSGMQRMLSQRIALISSELVLPENKNMQTKLLLKLKNSTKKMMENHIYLTEEIKAQHSSAIREIYFGSMNLDQRVKSYLNSANSIIAEYEKPLLSEGLILGQTRNLRLIARNGFLGDLNQAVSQFEKEASGRVTKFKLLETFLVCIGLILLVLEAFYIFRPMVKNIVSYSEELQKSNQELTSLTYRLSHDLKAPIRSNIGLLGILNELLEDEQREDVKKVVSHIDHCNKKVDRLIDDISVLMKNKLSNFEVKNENVLSLVYKASDSVKNLTEGQKAVALEVAGPENLSVKTKVVLLESIISNLVSNAYKYHDPSSERPYIKVQVEEMDGNCHIQVSDNGLGIPKDQEKKMFTMFQRFHPDKSFGSGLGLYLIKQGALALKGDVEYTRLESGSAFTIKIPKELHEEKDIAS